MTQRLFVAIWPGTPARQALEASVAAAQAEHPELRWQPPHRWHVTLAFLGEARAETAAGRIDRLLAGAAEAPGREPEPEPGSRQPDRRSGTPEAGAAMSRPDTRRPRSAAPEPEPIRLTGAGTFGPILWVGVEHGRWLADLATQLQSALRVDDRRFRAHVTVGRARGRPTEAARQARAAIPSLADHRGPPWLPTEVTLVASTNGPAPEYRVLERWPLRASPTRHP